MRRSILVLLIISLFTVHICGTINAQDTKENKKQSKKETSTELRRYLVDEVYVLYEIISDMFTGTEELYVADGGTREAKYTTMKIGKNKLNMPGMSQETHKASFVEGTWLYTVDLDNNTCTKTENEILISLQGKDIEDLGKQLIIDMGGVKVGTDTLLNKPCEIWEIKSLGTVSWYWNWIPLKTETNMMGLTITYIAKEIRHTIDKKKLDRPILKCDEAEDVMKKLQNMQKLNQPD